MTWHHMLLPFDARPRAAKVMYKPRDPDRTLADLGSGFSRFWATVLYSPQNISNVDTYYTSRQLGRGDAES